MKKYFELQEKTVVATHIKAEIFYSIGGYNYFTYKQEKRGYYISVTPVTYQNKNGTITEGFSAFSGIKLLLKEVSRKSAKAEKEATEKGLKLMEKLIIIVCNDNNLSVPDTATGGN